MEPRTEKMIKAREEAKNRFRIEKLEKRIAPKSLLHVNAHVGGSHIHVKI
jgi:hypothetical protein